MYCIKFRTKFCLSVKTYCVNVYLQGPGNCSSDAEKEISIKGICPKISDIQGTLESLDSTTQTMRIDLSMEGPAPQKFTSINFCQD